MKQYDWVRHDKVADSLIGVDYAVRQLTDSKSKEKGLAQKWALAESFNAASSIERQKAFSRAMEKFDAEGNALALSQMRASTTAAIQVISRMMFAAQYFPPHTDRDDRAAHDRDLSRKMVEDMAARAVYAEKLHFFGGTGSENALKQIRDAVACARQVMGDPESVTDKEPEPLTLPQRVMGLRHGHAQSADMLLDLAETQAKLARHCLTGALSLSTAHKNPTPDQWKKSVTFVYVAGLMAHAADYNLRLAHHELTVAKAMEDTKRPVFIGRLPQERDPPFAKPSGPAPH